MFDKFFRVFERNEDGIMMFMVFILALMMLTLVVGVIGMMIGAVV